MLPCPVLSFSAVPLKVFAESHNLKVHSVNSPRTLSNWEIPTPSGFEKFDLGVAVSFGYFIPKRIIDSFTLGAINVHPSLLPR